MSSESFTLVILVEKPYHNYRRRIPFNWYPSGSEIFDSIRRIRQQAINDGVTDVVKIKAVYLRKIETIESNCVDLDAVNGVECTIETDERVL